MSEPHSEPSWRFEVLFDGQCPVCSREIELLRRLDRGRGRVLFTELRSVAAGPGVPTRRELMDTIHGRTPDGEWVRGVEVFRRLYDAVGFGAAVRLSRAAPLDAMLQRAYAVFARNRWRLTGRACEDEHCAI